MEKVTGLPKMNMDNSETGCCPRFDPTGWDEKMMELDHLNMVCASTKSLFYVPLNMSRVMGSTMKAIADAGAELSDRYLVLSQDKSPWKCNHYFLVDENHPVPGLETVSFSGNFITKVFEGPFNKMPQWIKALESEVKEQGFSMENIYAFYTTCPKCAEHFGKNYVVLFARVS